ncbi:MAG TPA: hypothetical protein VEI94_08205, partial [Candidatus Bathyarchaeia archaeon]|nr:hypothetical protein [Candidatus Bathyarchaeia archaeon]
MRTVDIAHLPPPAGMTAGRADRATVAALRLSGLVLLCFSLAWLPSAQAACDPPRCFDVVVPVPSTIAVPDSTVRVLLPVDYGTTAKRYPVLYLLHGAG